MGKLNISYWFKKAILLYGANGYLILVALCNFTNGLAKLLKGGFRSLKIINQCSYVQPLVL